MGLMNLPLDERARVRWVLDWTSRMAQRHGGTVYEKDGRKWDWGQALVRECYGSDWNEKYSEIPDSPTWEDIARARQWEKGDIPEWVSKDNEERDECERCEQKKDSILTYSVEINDELYLCQDCRDKELQEAVVIT